MGGCSSGRRSQQRPRWRSSRGAATRPGHALVQVGERRLLLVDLRFARTVGDYEHTDPIEGIAFNPSGTVLALVARDPGGGLGLIHLSPRELFSSAMRAAVDGPAGAGDGAAAA